MCHWRPRMDDSCSSSVTMRRTYGAHTHKPPFYRRFLRQTWRPACLCSTLLHHCEDSQPSNECRQLLVRLHQLLGGGGVLLLVGQHQHLRIAQLVVAQHVLQRVACKRLFHSVTIKANPNKEADTFKAKRARSHHALAIERVHDVDDALAASVVVAPQCSNLVLAAHIPHSEANVLVPAQTRGS